MGETEDFIKEVRSLLDNIREELDIENIRQKYFKTVWRGEEQFLSFPRSVLSSYNKALLILKNKATATKKPVSDKQLEDMLVEFLFKLHFVHGKSALANLSKETSDLFEAVRRLQTQTYVVIIPLINIITDISLKIGYVEIANLDEPKIKQLEEKYKIRITGRASSAKEIVQGIVGDSKFTAVAIVEIGASDVEKAEELAIQTTDQSLNALRFYIVSFQGLIKGESLEVTNRRILIANVSNGEVNDRTQSLNRVIDPAHITQDVVNELKKLEFETLNVLLIKSPNEVTPLERDLLDAIYWVGSSVKDSLITDKFLKYVIALDSLLAQDRRDKSETVSRRFTALMYNNAKNDEIHKAYSIMKKLYRLRNDIMHAGLSHIEKSDFDQLTYWTHTLVYKLLKYSKKYSRLQDAIDKEFPVRDDLFDKENEK